jgi:hypothetical protein
MWVIVILMLHTVTVIGSNLLGKKSKSLLQSFVQSKREKKKIKFLQLMSQFCKILQKDFLKILITVYGKKF